MFLPRLGPCAASGQQRNHRGAAYRNKSSHCHASRDETSRFSAMNATNCLRRRGSHPTSLVVSLTENEGPTTQTGTVARLRLCFRKAMCCVPRRALPTRHDRRRSRPSMRLSRYFLPTLRETPKEAEIVSHRLMLRAGLIRQEAAGIYAWLPLGLRVLNKVCAVVRTEQDRAGAIELLMPTCNRRTSGANRAATTPTARRCCASRIAMSARCSTARPPRRWSRRSSAASVRSYKDLPQEPLPDPVEVPRRGAAALRHHAVARVPDEGRLFLRRRPGGRAPRLQPHVRRLSAHLRAARPQGDPDAGRYRTDRRRSQPRIHHPRRDRRERGVLRSRTTSTSTSRRRHRLRRRRRPAGEPSTAGPRSTRRPARCTTPAAFAAVPRGAPDVGPRHRGRAHLLFRDQVLRSRWAPR